MTPGNDDEQDPRRWLGHTEDPASTQPGMTPVTYAREPGYRAQPGEAIAAQSDRDALQTWYHPDGFMTSPYLATSLYSWPSNYITSGVSAEELASIPGYTGGAGNDNDSTSALEDILLQQQIANFQSPFDASYPFQSISGGQVPEGFQLAAARQLPAASSGAVPPDMPAVSRVFVLPSSAHASPSPVRGSPVTATAAALPVDIPVPQDAAPARGKKRAAPRSKKVKTGSESSTGEPIRPTTASSQPEASWPRKTAATTSPGESGESAAAAAAARRTGRKGPLPPGAREKIEEVRSSGACWRCRRYKKPCNNRSGTCDTCLTSGFRIWPASLGCRRGDTQEFVDAILPAHTEEVLETLPPDLPRPHTWRPSLEPRIVGPPSSADGRTADKWDHLCEKILGTRLYGQEFVELFEIMAQYQRDAPKEDPIFNLVAATLSYNVDLYHQFINLGPATVQPQATAGNPHPASATVMSLRASLTNTLSTWLSLCLRGRMHDFPIAFLSATLELCGLLVFSDSVASLKQLTGTLIWAVDARDQMIVLRRELMTIALDLLGVVAKGAKPLRFRCWRREPGADGSPGERSAEGMRLMGGNVAAFEAMAALQRWICRWRGTLESDVWFESPPFTAGIRPIQALARFVRMGHGDFEDQ